MNKDSLTQDFKWKNMSNSSMEITKKHSSVGMFFLLMDLKSL